MRAAFLLAVLVAGVIVWRSRQRVEVWHVAVDQQRRSD
jgi:hypothetical protein